MNERGEEDRRAGRDSCDHLLRSDVEGRCSVVRGTAVVPVDVGSDEFHGAISLRSWIGDPNPVAGCPGDPPTVGVITVEVAGEVRPINFPFRAGALTRGDGYFRVVRVTHVDGW